jgi:hypothetical protein
MVISAMDCAETEMVNSEKSRIVKMDLIRQELVLNRIE